MRKRVGMTLNGKYRLERLIGSGGMAAVYSAVHRNGNRVAIKILHPHVGVDASLRERFLREGYIANAVGHPGAVRVHDDDVSEDRSVFLVMELLEGETVDARASRSSGRLAVREVCELGYQLLDVLSSAHARGIVHRDIKPENLFLTSDGILKVLDFGIARLGDPSDSPSATRTGLAFGTPAFMAPEQALGKTHQIDAQSDLFSVGATLFTLLTGSLVQEAETVQELMIYMATRPARSLREVAPELPAEIAEVIDRAIRFQKSERWADARSMAEALAEAHERVFGVTLSAVRGGSAASTLPWGEAPPRKSVVPPQHPRLGTDGAVWSRSPRSTPPEELLVESSPAGARRLGRVSPILVSAFAAIAVIGLGVAALLSSSAESPVANLPAPSVPPAQSAPPPALAIEPTDSLVMGSLSVRGASDLRVFLDGQEIGNAPREIRDVSPGEHIVLIEGGERYERQETHLTVSAGQETTLEPKLPVKTGLASIEAGKNAEGAQIEISSESAPPRPLSTLPTQVDVPVGHGYRLLATKPGFEPFEMTLEFDDGQAERTFVIDLEPVSESPSKPVATGPSRPAQPRTAQHSSPQPRPAKPSPAQPSELPAQPSSPQPSPAQPPEFPPPEQTVSLDEAPPSPVDEEEKGFLNLNSVPYSNVILDGKPLGNTPKMAVAASPGAHSIIFIHPELGRKSRTVMVIPGQTITVSATF